MKWYYMSIKSFHQLNMKLVIVDSSFISNYNLKWIIYVYVSYNYFNLKIIKYNFK